MSAVQKKRLHLCGSCLGLVVLADDERDVCRHCGAADEEGPCGCEGCVGIALDLLTFVPQFAHLHGDRLDERYYQRGVNWTRRGISGEPVPGSALLTYDPCDPRRVGWAGKPRDNYADADMDACALQDALDPSGESASVGVGEGADGRPTLVIHLRGGVEREVPPTFRGHPVKVQYVDKVRPC